MKFSTKAVLAAALTVAAISVIAPRPASAAALAPDSSFDAPLFRRPSTATRVVLLPDGKFLRYFNTITLLEQRTGPMTRHFPDGSVDTSFRMGSEFESVGAAAADSLGRIIVTVLQREYSGGTEKVMRLNADGSIDASFKVSEISSNGAFEVLGIVPLPDGKIVVSGSFTNFAGTRRTTIVRLFADGTFDPSFVNVTASSSNGTLIGIGSRPALQADGKLVISGNFTRVNGSTVPGVARLNPDGTLDNTFQPSGFTRGGTIRDPIILPDGKIVLGGRFSSSYPSGTYSNLPLIRLHTNGAIDQSYGYLQSSTAGSFLIRNLALQQDGKIVAADLLQRTIFRFNGDGSLDAGFRQPRFLINRTRNMAVSPITVDIQPDNRILIAGNFTDVDDETGPFNGSRHGIARFNSDGTLDPTLTTSQKTARPDYPDSFARLPDRTTLIGFSRASNTGEAAVPHGFGRLRPDGSLDTSFDSIGPTDPNGSLTPALITQGFRVLLDGRIFLFGTKGFLGPFTYGRLEADGREDKSFVPDPALLSQFSNGADTVLPQRDGKVLIGSFTPQGVVNGPLRRIEADGSIDRSFELDPKIASQLVGREEGTGLIVRIDASSRLLAVQPDGKILFINSGVLQRLSSNGSIDETFKGVSIQVALSLTYPVIFDPLTGRSFQPAEGVVEGEAVVDTAVQPDGRIIITGPWITPEGNAAPGITRLNADGSDDPSFQVGSGPQWIQTSAAGQRPLIEQIELQTDGRLLVVGTFEAFNGVPAPGIVSLNPDGSVDTSFVAPAVRQKSIAGRAKLARQPDGSYLLSGPYSYPGDTSAPSLLRIVPSAVANISTRISVGTGENALIGGFIISGNAPKKVLIRALGPSLRAGAQPVAGSLQDPTMDLRDRAGEVVASNDDWRSHQEQEIIATTVPPADHRESAIVATLEPGAYTAVIRGKNDSTGIGLVEVYDLGTASFDTASDATLANISTRGLVQTNDNVMIGGFIVTGAPTRVIVRAIGPSLSGSGVAGALQNTTLEFVDGNGSVVAANDDWRTGGQEQQIIETTVPPSDDRESAIVATVNPGPYTAIVRGKEGTAGVALVEVYVLQ